MMVNNDGSLYDHLLVMQFMMMMMNVIIILMIIVKVKTVIGIRI